MHCLITGGAGFIGSYLAEELINRGNRVTVIDNLSTGNIHNLSSIIRNPLLNFLHSDILNMQNLKDLVSESDIVYHLAAAVGVDIVVKDPVYTITTNVKGTERVLEAALENKTKILVASTSEVYGKSNKNFFSEEDDLLIGPPTHSRWSYACSKLLDEFYCSAFYKEYKLPVNIVRLFNTVGPRQTGKYGMVLPRFVQAALEGKDLNVFGTGKQTRCFCHVRDVVRCVLALSEKEFNGQVYNIGSNEICSIEALARRVISISGSTSGIVYKSYNEAYAPGFEDMLHRAPDISKIKKLTGWEPHYSLDNIIADVVDYYRNKKGRISPAF
ncbi:MAG TPA: nucleoside-diphosphate sugar epimerase [Lentisphaeria bacterium]|nr:MAG: nucleoside-diphosphate sugar epimerase [Lentisphaerae bacterium GWF2_38_69]HBM16220.1 nucleoside-diphosphate sugar epimerase [Lentisphaeria bacterium]